ncbi:uncharacterized protein LOC126900332 [Daktulosphaira vitifoliae]|uniref:uncharacterized protein LOC126900332 n=1 Tax=Daktulosphaira vitifoliae TaxID=58002 RepID=UPI0021A9C272|nr:uncharacterized protein LOC126900332 [Daktulosphaira vitifoliae]
MTVAKYYHIFSVICLCIISTTKGDNSMQVAIQEMFKTNEMILCLQPASRDSLLYEFIGETPYEDIEKYLFLPHLEYYRSSEYGKLEIDILDNEVLFQKVVQLKLTATDTTCDIDNNNKNFTLNDYNEEARIRYNVLLPPMRRLLHEFLVEEKNCSSDNGVKCKLIALIKRAEDPQIVKEIPRCGKIPGQCLIDTIYKDGTKIKNKFLDYEHKKRFATMILDHNNNIQFWDIPVL